VIAATPDSLLTGADPSNRASISPTRRRVPREPVIAVRRASVELVNAGRGPP
jgi:hypothetical protein